MNNDVYVVRSAEADPVFYAAVPTLEDAKRVLEGLEEAEVIDPDLGGDYEVVPLYGSAEEALNAVLAEEGS